MNGASPTPVDIAAGDLPEDAPDASGQMVGYVSCPEALVSKLIGKKGTVIQALESLTGAKIQVEHQKTGDPKHVRIIAKTQEDLDKTKATIKETLESEHPLGEVTRTISCPHAMVGRIIGRAGQTILSLQQASQAKIIVDQDPERFPEGAPRDIRIVGMAQCVERAEKMVAELINAESGVSAQSVVQKVRCRRAPAATRCTPLGTQATAPWSFENTRICLRPSPVPGRLHRIALALHGTSGFRQPALLSQRVACAVWPRIQSPDDLPSWHGGTCHRQAGRDHQDVAAEHRRQCPD
jgi:rRNA processing protein Krr1/Pno1